MTQDKAKEANKVKTKTKARARAKAGTRGKDKTEARGILITGRCAYCDETLEICAMVNGQMAGKNLVFICPQCAQKESRNLLVISPDRDRIKVFDMGLFDDEKLKEGADVSIRFVPLNAVHQTTWGFTAHIKGA